MIRTIVSMALGSSSIRNRLLIPAIVSLLASACSAPPGDDATSSAAEVSTQIGNVTFRTQIGGNFVGAQNNGGGAVIATATQARAWETFTILDQNGGALVSGDAVFIKAGNGQYFQAVNGGGSSLNAGSNNQLGWETFRIFKASGSGTIASGDLVAVQASSGSWISAENGGGGPVFAYGPALGSWEKMTIGLGATSAPDAGTNPPPPPPPPPPPSNGLRVVAYLPNYSGSYGNWAHSINFAKMTHLNLAFATPNGSNDWNMGASDSDVRAIVDAAHAAGVKVLPSLGGGGGDQAVIARYKDAGNIDGLVAKLDSFVTAHNFDGVDVDIEDPGNLGANFSSFVDKTVAKMRPRGKLVTAAVAQYLQGSMSDTTLRQFDFVNVMIYSSYQQSVSDMNYYTQNKGLSPSKVTLGAGFFGTDSSWQEYAYKDIVHADPGAYGRDQANVNGKTVNYTGMASMKRLADLSKSYGGIMFWELSEDTNDEHSLYKVIQGEF